MYIYNIKSKNMEQEPLPNIPSTTSVQGDELERACSKGGFFKAIIFFLLILILLLSVFVYLIFTKSPLLPSSISALLFDTTVYDVCESCETKDEGEDVRKGWAKYSFPEYGFSIELPDTSYFDEDFPEYRYVWSIYSHDIEEKSGLKVLPDLEEVISISYFPINPPATDTEIDIFRGSQIDIFFYRNPEKLNIQQIEAIFKDKIENELFKEFLYEEEKVYKSEFLQLYGKDAFNYEHGAAMFNAKGSVLVTGDFVVQIDKSRIFSVGEHLDLVNEVLNTIKFDY